MKRTNLDTLIKSRKEKLALRDQFAMAALQGLIANTDRDGSVKTFALDAYAFADAMLAQREVK